MPNTLIITPAYTQPTRQTMGAVQASGLPWSVEHGHSDLVRVRSFLIGKALETDAERIILLDADVVPRPEALQWLATTDLVTPDVAVWGLYPLKDQRWSVEPKVVADFDAARDGDLVAIEWGGLGICCIHRESLERAEAGLQASGESPVIEDNGVKWTPYCLPFVEDGKYHGDDRSLCARLRRAGVDLVCRRDLVAGHMALGMLTHGRR